MAVKMERERVSFSILGTGVSGLMRGMTILPQGNQELLVVKDEVGRPQASLGP